MWGYPRVDAERLIHSRKAHGPPSNGVASLKRPDLADLADETAVSRVPLRIDGRDTSVINGRNTGVIDEWGTSVIDGRATSIINGRDKSVVDGRDTCLIDGRDTGVVPDQPERWSHWHASFGNSLRI